MLNILPYSSDRLPDILRITEQAWGPVFPLLREDIPNYVYDAFYPDGWLKRQLADVEALFKNDDTSKWVAEYDGKMAGYLGLREHPEDSMGEIHIIAVDPRFQRCGVGKGLIDFAFDWMVEKGFQMAFVETGDDRGHAPARASYESAGFERYPVARYFKEL